MTIKKGREIDVSIENVAFGGRGITRVDGLAVFVDQAVPGDRARIRVRRKKKSYAEAYVVSLIEGSPDRITPPCPYSGYCGGCKWQFLKYERQLEYKRQFVLDSLSHIGGEVDPVVHPTLPSPTPFEYRNKMEFSCSDRRWLLPSELGNMAIGRDFALGLHVPGTFDKVLDTEACLLHPASGNTLLSMARDHMKQSNLPPYGLRSHEGFWRFLMLRHSVARDQWLVNIITAAETPSAVVPLADAFMDCDVPVAGVVNNITSRKAGIAVGEWETPLRGESTLVDRIGDYRFEVSANSFFQTNTRGATVLYDTVKEYAALGGSEVLWDLYCGTGTIAIYLAESAKTVLGIELASSAVADAERNARWNGVDNCRFLQGDIKDLLAGIGEQPDVLVIDPPRAGMHESVVTQVRTAAPSRIVYVSCNPATMARDVALLAEDYQLIEVQPVDLFPHTYHVEAVGRLQRRHSASGS